MTTLPIAILLTSFFTAFAIGFQFYIRRTFQQETLEEQSHIIDPLLGVVGTLFSVLLGFLVAGAMDSYHDTATTVESEANSIANVFRVAQGLAKVDRVRIRQIARDYVNAVVDDEWKLMEKQKTSPKAWNAYGNLWEASLAVQPGDDNRITNIQQTLLDSINALGESRRLRVVASQHGLTIVQWLVILIGAAITVLFTLFFPMRTAIFHVFLIILITVSLGLNIWLLAAYSTPFCGELAIRPYMFQLLRDELLIQGDGPTKYLTADDLADDAAPASKKKDDDSDDDSPSAKGTKKADDDSDDDDDAKTKKKQSTPAKKVTKKH